MYCEYCGKATTGGRCADCGRRPTRFSLNVFALLVGWFAILGLFLEYAFIYPLAVHYFTALNVSLPLPTRIIAPVAAPFGNGWIALAAAVVLLLLAVVFRRIRADKWLATVAVLLVVLNVLASFAVGMPTMSLFYRLSG